MKPNKFSLDFDDEINENSNSKAINKEKLDAFAKGAVTHSTNLLIKEERNWRDEDPYAEPSFRTTLRLNLYELGLLKEAAKKHSRSINSRIRIALVKELEKTIL
jgi:hypothetical protein